jgi:hypothetical protein
VSMTDVIRLECLDRARPVADALLYEGYALYPYRASSIKNRRRFDFGVLHPPAWCAAGGGDACAMRTECLVRVRDPGARVRCVVRFLQLVERRTGDAPPWDEAVERQMALPEMGVGELARGSARRAFALAGACEEDAAAGSRRRSEAIEASVEAGAVDEGEGVLRVAIAVENTSAWAGAGREEAMLRSLVSTHTLIAVAGAELVSLLEPPDALREAAARCRNVGTWPVLLGEPWERDAMLSSPIILYDHPRVAPESRGDLYDATEIDEILTLRTLTLTDAERREAAAGDPRVRELLARAEAGGQAALAALHGAVRRAPVPPRPGTRVTLRPGRRADVMDIALAGRTATVAAVETDFEGRTYVAVTVDDDPGADLGARGQPGHRFFFHLDEIEALP